MTLFDLQPGQKGIILQIKGNNFLRKRLLEMGFVQGKTISVIRKAPLQDPIEYEIMGYHVLLRGDEAKNVKVILLSDTTSTETEKQFKTQNIHVEEESISIERNNKEVIRITIVGNPNCGKSTIYNFLTGERQSVANYPGTTVDARIARLRYKGYVLELVDLPGIYSLSSFTTEEQLVAKIITENFNDIILNVLDASNLMRNLYLTTQLLDVGKPMVIALNMYDELIRKGDQFNLEKFSQLIGVPMVYTIGRKNVGLEKLLDKVIDVYQNTGQNFRHIHINYGEVVEKSIELLEQNLIKTNIFYNYSHMRFYAIRLLEKDPVIFNFVSNRINEKELRQNLLKPITTVENFYNDTSEKILSSLRYSFIEGALKETYKAKQISSYTKSKNDLLDKVFLNRFLGFPAFVFILWLVFYLTFKFGGKLADYIDISIQWLASILTNFLPEGILSDLIVEGIIGGVGGVIVFLPNILILFFFISILEGSGYLARVAFLMDHIMHRIGLHGKSFIPLIMGFGCNVPAIMATRTLENKSDKILTILLIPLMSCSARLPVYVLIISVFFPDNPSLILVLVYSIGILFAGLFSILFRRIFFKKQDAPFVMELPPYRIPNFRTIISFTWFRASQYLKKMATVILLASIIIWFLGSFPRNVNFTQDYEKLFTYNIQKYNSLINSTNNTDSIALLEHEKFMHLDLLVNKMQAEIHSSSYIGMLGRLIEPLMKPLNFDWRISIALLMGFPAKEIIVSTMGILFQQYEVDRNNPNLLNFRQKSLSLEEKIKNAVSFDKPTEPLFNKINAFALLLFVLFYFPCTASILAIHKETQKIFYTLFSVIYTTTFSWIIAFVFTTVATLLI